MMDEEIETDWKNFSESIFNTFFDQTKAYVARMLTSQGGYMDCLKAYYDGAWSVPKKYKGNSGAMGFVPEYLVFETVRQYLEKKYGIAFRKKERTYTAGQVETFYFVDDLADPQRLLVHGLRIRRDSFGFPPTDYQHDITYAVREGEWRVKAVVEVKGFFDGPSLRADLGKLEAAERKYSKADDCSFAFVGFIPSSNLPGPMKENIKRFVARRNHSVVLPGAVDPELGNTRLEDLLGKL
jgi:hypothetical protein